MKRKNRYADIQETVKNDIDRAFRLLQRKWKIILNSHKFLSKKARQKIINCVIIFHYMFVEECYIIEAPYKIETDES